MNPFPARAAAATTVLLLAVPVAVPVLSALAAWATPATEVWSHQLQHVLPRAGWNTALLVLLVVAGATVLGTALAWLVAAHDFPGRRFFGWALLAPLAVPGYVMAVVFAGALDFSGPLQTAGRALLGDAWRLPSVRSIGGAALVLTLTLYPYVYMLARVAFESTGARALEAAQSLGLDRGAAFRRVLLPMARPAIAAGIGLVAMETLADFGVVAALNVDTFTTSIYRAWFGMFSLAAALQMAALLALLALVVAGLERRLRGGRGFASQRSSGGMLQRVRLPAAQGLWATAAASTVLAVAFVLPLAQLLAWACQHAAVDLDGRYLGFVLRSVALATAGSIVIVLAAVALGYALRSDRRSWLQSVGRFASVGYALPGTVLAVGLFAPIAVMNGWMQAWLDLRWGSAAPQLALQGTLFTMLLAYLARFLAVGAGRWKAGWRASTATSTKSRCPSASVALRSSAVCTCRCCAAACSPPACSSSST
jgi:iron(III) transport system permease protein